jgi:hypothetical protein
MEQELLNPKARFRVHGKLYKISKNKPKKRNLVLDVRNNTCGIHDGVTTKGFINVRDGHAVEIGCPKDKIYKLVLARKADL